MSRWPIPNDVRPPKTRTSNLITLQEAKIRRALAGRAWRTDGGWLVILSRMHEGQFERAYRGARTREEAEATGKLYLAAGWERCWIRQKDGATAPARE